MELYDKNDNISYITRYYKDNNDLKITISANCTSYWIIINDNVSEIEKYTFIDTANNNIDKAYDIVNKRYGDLISITDKGKLLEYIEATQMPNNNKNRMGCSESWYDPFYAIKQTFSKYEIMEMSKDEINDLFRLACNIQDALY